MMDEINASRWRGAVHEAQKDPVFSDTPVRSETVMAVDSEIHYLVEQITERQARIGLFVAIPTAIVFLFVGWGVCQLKHDESHHHHVGAMERQTGYQPEVAK